MELRRFVHANRQHASFCEFPIRVAEKSALWDVSRLRLNEAGNIGLGNALYKAVKQAARASAKLREGNAFDTTVHGQM
jgi:hypothetical protein